ncbi:MAG: RNA-binding S4 domain-containing protein [Gammaproteobacteria bacterium]
MQSVDDGDGGGTDAVRVDKWLWAARFFKTRAAAAQAIKAGRVEVNGARPKPARALAPGDVVLVRRAPFEQTVIVRALSAVRGPAAIASTLYEETAQSIARREALALALRAQARARPDYAGRPQRRDRREMLRLKGRTLPADGGDPDP